MAIVLPKAIAADGALTDSLAVEVLAGLHRTVDARRVLPDHDTGSLVDTIGRAVVYGERPPATLPELLRHEEAAQCVAIVVASDLPDRQQREFPEMLRRLEAESRFAMNSDRLTIVCVVSRNHLPHFAGGESSDVSLATVWWWNRVARWDVAAHMSAFDSARPESRVLSDVRAETIVEVARWDLDLAEELATSWSGDPHSLLSSLSEAAADGVKPVGAPSACGVRPGEAIIEQWDSRQIDGWHDAHSVTAHALTFAPEQLDRLVWAAQARILLPWIEERRAVLYSRVKAFMGHRRFRAALENLFTPPLTNTNLIEIGPLKRIVDIRIGAANPMLRAAARRLHDARNRLAHLEPLAFAELRELVAACEELR